MPTDYQIDHLEQQLISILHGNLDAGFRDRMNALVHALTFEIALFCPDCRKAIARQLRKRIPQMLEDANCLAATAGRREHQHLQ
jgi:hypothetical protein